MRRRLVPRSLLGQLVATAVVAAVVLIGVGGIAFRLQLHRGLRANLDASLSARAGVLAAELRAAADPRAVPVLPPPRTGVAGAELPNSVNAVFAPDGTLVGVEPAGAAAAVPASLGRVGTPTWRQLTSDGRTLRLRAEPVSRADGTWVVVAGADTAAVDESSDEVDRAVLLFAPLLVLVIGLGSWALTRSALRPVERMRREVSALGEHDPAGRVSEPASAAELAALAGTFNDLLARLHASLAQQRALVADAGHELRTPLAVLSMELELADRPGRSRVDLREAVVHARTEVDRLIRLSEDLLRLAAADAALEAAPGGGADRSTAGVAALAAPNGAAGVSGDGSGSARRVVPLARLLAEAARAWRASFDETGVDLIIGSDGDPAAVLDRDALRAALDNLLANALRHTPAGGSVRMGAASVDGGVQIEVRDDGPGFPADFLPHAFERFRQAEAARREDGFGLGLALVAATVRAHGGTVRAENVAPRGARVVLWLPGGRSGATAAQRENSRTATAP